jgi:hypothetical protein
MKAGLKNEAVGYHKNEAAKNGMRPLTIITYDKHAV